MNIADLIALVLLFSPMNTEVSVSGKVYNAETMEPLSQVEIEFFSDHELVYQTKSDSSGRSEFKVSSLLEEIDLEFRLLFFRPIKVIDVSVRENVNLDNVRLFPIGNKFICGQCIK